MHPPALALIEDSKNKAMAAQNTRRPIAWVVDQSNCFYR